MLQDRDGYMWLSNFKSKYTIDTKSPRGYTKLKAVDIPDHIAKDKLLYFNSGLIDSDGNLWMTTSVVVYGSMMDGHSPIQKSKINMKWCYSFPYTKIIKVPFG